MNDDYVLPTRECLPKRGKSLSYRVLTAFLAFIFLQQGCAATIVTNQPLTFTKHGVSLRWYSTSEFLLKVTYGNFSIYDWENRSDKQRHEVAEKRSGDGYRPAVRISKGFFRAFEGPLTMEWRDLDGEKHQKVLELDAIFKDRIIPHHEDPNRIDPQVTVPFIAIEMDERTLSLYLETHIWLKATESSPRTFKRYIKQVYCETL